MAAESNETAHVEAYETAVLIQNKYMKKRNNGRYGREVM